MKKKKELIKDDTVENNGNFKSNLIGENIQEENSENNLSTQVKNQLKNINQIKTNPIKNLSSEANNNKIESMKTRRRIIV